MKKTIRVQFSVAALAAAGSLLGASAGAQDLGIEVGAPAPAVTVQALDGKQVNLAQYIGKTPMLIEFWATWCPNCRELMPTLLDVEKKYGQQVKFVALAVAINQSPERVRKFLAAHPLPHETLYDTDGKAASAFDAPATSYVVVVDKSGRVVYTGLGGKQDLDAAIRKAL
ncbi:MAG TPA: TlpA disulfide reductase family protein [Gemmatimonadaceae bacterium]|jgi:thiol-disulfide isomerase/thioredoxin|nr:TlpA disulfide reductase family protein [Gemmatimonadaceae bacterium]